MNSQSLLDSQNLTRMVSCKNKRIFFQCSQTHLTNSYRNLEDSELPWLIPCQFFRSLFLEDSSFCMSLDIIPITQWFGLTSEWRLRKSGEHPHHWHNLEIFSMWTLFLHYICFAESSSHSHCQQTPALLLPIFHHFSLAINGSIWFMDALLLTSLRSRGVTMLRAVHPNTSLQTMLRCTGWWEGGTKPQWLAWIRVHFKGLMISRKKVR